MIAIKFCLRRLPALTLSEFQDYWLNQHAPLVRSVAETLGIRRYVQSHALDDDGLSRVVQEEAFGPVLPLLKFRDIDEVVARANACEYGLGGSIWSADTEAAADIASRLETGTVWINDTLYIMPWTPFAGHKQSGIGVENGKEGLLEFTVPQTITIAK